MPETERRHVKRREEAFSVSFVTVGHTGITGTSVNFSGEGVFLHAEGRISVILDMKGKTVRGQLVWASPLDPNTTAYAIALDETFSE